MELLQKQKTITKPWLPPVRSDRISFMKTKSPSFNKFEFSPKKTKYCLIIPVINEGLRFKKEIESLKKYTSYLDIIIADGGSTDGSTNKSFLRKNKVRTLLVKTCPGKLGVQYRIGFVYAINQGYEGIITMDGNGKDGPSALPNFIKKLDEGYDYIQGSRFIKGGKAINTPPLRYFGNRLILAPILSLGAKKIYTDTSNGYRAYSVKYLSDKKLNLFRDVFFSYEILFYLTVKANQLGFKSIEIPVSRKYPKGKIPTKIKTLRSNLNIIQAAIRASSGYYDPK